MASSASGSIISSRLDEMPDLVLYRIAEFLSARIDRITLLRLGLAAPIFYAPCLHVAIRTATKFEWINEQDGMLASSSRNDLVAVNVLLVGRVVLVGNGAAKAESAVASCEFGTRAFLVLPLRTLDRTPIHVLWSSDLKSRVEGISRHWTVIPVPLHQLSSFHVNSCAGHVPAVPPQCQRVVISGHQFGSGRPFDWGCVAIPWTVTDLDVTRVIPQRADTLATMQLRLPPCLRRLRLEDAFCYSRHDDEANNTTVTLVWVLQQMPPTITSLSLQYRRDIPAHAKRALAAMLLQLPALSEFSLQVRGLTDVDVILAALPRARLHRLTLGLWDSLGTIDDVLHHAALLSSLPTSVLFLDFRGNFAMDQLPLAKQTLLLTRTTWKSILRHHLPVFAETLTRLTIGSALHAHLLGGRSRTAIRREHNLVPLFKRLPASLTHLAINDLILVESEIEALARYLPPQLVFLALAGCTDGHNELPLDVLASNWPASFLYCTKYGAILPHFPSNLRALRVSHDMDTRANLYVRAWVDALPAKLQVLSFSWSCFLSYALVEALVERRGVRIGAGIKRMQVRVGRSGGHGLERSDATMEMLRSGFDVVVLNNEGDESWDVMFQG